MKLMGLGFHLFPVIAEFPLARHSTLIPDKPFLMFSETFERLSEAIKHFTNYSVQQTKDKITQQFQ
jgi:hypothetical protein